MVKLSTKIVQMLFERGIISAPQSDHPFPFQSTDSTRSEIINAIDAVIDLHVQERSEEITDFLDDSNSGLVLTEERVAEGHPLPKVRYDDGGYELQVLNFDNRWAKMRIIENDEIIFVAPNDLKHYIIINE